MKTHKISGIEKNVCTCEQKIAYNMAFSDYDCINNVTEKEGRVAGLSFAYKMRDNHIRKMIEDGTRYNMDAVFCAYNAGIENYCGLKFHILTSYKEIGEAFPILY